MENEIRHEGVIEAIDGHTVSVRIRQTAACAGCKIASRCHTAEAKDKIIDVNTVGDDRRWSIGQEVVVSTATGMAARALLIAFALPLTLMLAALAAATLAGLGEGTAALLSVGVLIPYYAVVWLLRKRIAGAISFRIEQ